MPHSHAWLCNFKEPEGQLARWLGKLQEFHFEIVHRGGKKHCNADALSRLLCRQCGRTFDESDSVPMGVSAVSEECFVHQSLVQTDIAQLRKDQREDPSLGPIIEALESSCFPSKEDVKGKSLECRRLQQLKGQLVLKDGILYRRYVSTGGQVTHNQLVIPKVSREELLEELHSGSGGGHLGEEKTRGRLMERFYWPGHWNDVHHWCQSCSTCASRKTPTPKRRAALQPIKVSYPMQPESDNANSYVLVVADYFTKWVEAFPMPNQEARTVAKNLVDEVFCRFSIPEQLHSDQGRQFESEVIGEICKLLHIRKSRTTPYHPQLDGMVERFNRTLLSMLSTCIEEHPFEWEDHLRKVCLAYNTSTHSTTGHTPFFLMFGRQARLPVDVMFGTPLPASEATDRIPTYVLDLKRTLTAAYDKVRAKMGTQQERQKENYDSKVHGEPFQTGDLVWLFNPALPRGKARKFHRPWTGPHRIVERISTANYKLQHVYNRKRTVVHFDRLKRCPPSLRVPTPNRQPQSRSPPPAAVTAPGQHTELLEFDDPSPPSPPRYPRRNHRQPDRLQTFIRH